MNWTGGRLQQSRRTKAGLSAQQKAYFAKARARLGNEHDSRSPLNFLPFGTDATAPGEGFPLLQYSRGESTKRVNLERSSHIANSILQKSDHATIQKLPNMTGADFRENGHSTSRLRSSDVFLSPLADRKRKRDRCIQSDSSDHDETASQTERATIEKKRLELLNRADWLTPVRRRRRRRLLNIRFPSRKEREKVARRRKLNREDLERLKQQRRDRAEKIASFPEGQPHSLHDSISIRHGTQVHGTQRTQDRISITQSSSSETFLPASEGQSLSSSLEQVSIDPHRVPTGRLSSPYSAPIPHTHIRREAKHPLPSEISEESSWNPNFSSDCPRQHSEPPDKDLLIERKATSELCGSDLTFHMPRRLTSSENESLPFHIEPFSAEKRGAVKGSAHAIESLSEQYTEPTELRDASTQIPDSGIDPPSVSSKSGASSGSNESHKRTEDASMSLKSNNGGTKTVYEGETSNETSDFSAWRQDKLPQLLVEPLSSDCDDDDDDDQSLRSDAGRETEFPTPNLGKERKTRVRAIPASTAIRGEMVAIKFPATESSHRDHDKVWQQQVTDTDIRITEPNPLAVWLAESEEEQFNATLAGSSLNDGCPYSQQPLSLSLQIPQPNSTEAQAPSSLAKPRSQPRTTLDRLDSSSLESRTHSNVFDANSRVKTWKQQPRDFLFDDEGSNNLCGILESGAESSRGDATRRSQQDTESKRIDGTRMSSLSEGREHYQSPHVVTELLKTPRKQSGRQSFDELPQAKRCGPNRMRDVFRNRREQTKLVVQEEVED